MSENDTGGDDAAVEREARAMGHIPREEFKGDPEKWIDAKTFLERGKSVMPILKKNNERLMQDIQSLRQQNAELQSQVKDSVESVAELKKFHAENIKQRVAAAKQEIVEQIKKAREDGDVSAEVEANDRLADLREAEGEMEAEAEAERKPPAAPAKDFTKEQWFVQWREENSWFGQDKRRTALAMGIGEELRASRPDLRGKDFLDEIAVQVEEVFGGKRPSKVEGGRNGAGSGTGKSYNELPADAKAACDRQVDRLVGPNRAFKTVAEWRKYYVNSYFGEGA
jgi:hypothetical protein